MKNTSSGCFDFKIEDFQVFSLERSMPCCLESGNCLKEKYVLPTAPAGFELEDEF